jgi:hypothetical protein
VRAIQTISEGGSSDSEHKEVAVQPDRCSPRPVVTKATPLTNSRIARRKAALPCPDVAPLIRFVCTSPTTQTITDLPLSAPSDGNRRLFEQGGLALGDDVAPIAIKLDRGFPPGRLADARETMLSIPPVWRREPVWQYVAELLEDAAADRASVTEVEEMLVRGLKAAWLL